MDQHDFAKLVYEYRFKTRDEQWSQKREGTFFDLFGLARKSSANSTKNNNSTALAHFNVDTSTQVVVTLHEVKAEIEKRHKEVKSIVSRLKVNKKKPESIVPAQKVYAPAWHQKKYQNLPLVRENFSQASKSTASGKSRLQRKVKTRDEGQHIPFLEGIMTEKIKRAEGEEGCRLLKQQALQSLHEKQWRKRAKSAHKLAAKTAFVVDRARKHKVITPRPPAGTHSIRTQGNKHLRHQLQHQHRQHQHNNSSPFSVSREKTRELPTKLSDEHHATSSIHSQAVASKRSLGLLPTSSLAVGGETRDILEPQDGDTLNERFYFEQRHVFSPIQLEATERLFRALTNSKLSKSEDGSNNNNDNNNISTTKNNNNNNNNNNNSSSSNTSSKSPGTPNSPNRRTGQTNRIKPDNDHKQQFGANRVMTFAQFEQCMSKRFLVDRDAYLIQRVYDIMCGPTIAGEQNEGLTFAKFAKIISICVQGNQQLRLFLCFAIFDADGDGVLSQHDIFNLLRWNVDEFLRQDISFLINWVYQNKEGVGRVQATIMSGATTSVIGHGIREGQRNEIVTRALGGFGHLVGENNYDDVDEAEDNLDDFGRQGVNKAHINEPSIALSFAAFRKLWPRKTVPVLNQYIAESFGLDVIGAKFDFSLRSGLGGPTSSSSSSSIRTNNTTKGAHFSDAGSENGGRQHQGAGGNNNAVKMSVRGVLAFGKARKGLINLIKVRRVTPAEFVKNNTTEEFLRHIGVSVADANMLAANFQPLVTNARDTSSKRDFCELLCKTDGAFGENTDSFLAARLFGAINTNGSGNMTFEEFLTAITTAHRGNVFARASLTFRIFDINSSKIISAKDLETILDAGLEKISPKDATLMLDAIFDKVRDSQQGTISIDEFISLYAVDGYVEKVEEDDYCDKVADVDSSSNKKQSEALSKSALHTPVGAVGAAGCFGRTVKSNKSRRELLVSSKTSASKSSVQSKNSKSKIPLDLAEPFLILRRFARIFWGVGVCVGGSSVIKSNERSHVKRGHPRVR